jgi:hypothetical protein
MAFTAKAIFSEIIVSKSGETNGSTNIAFYRHFLKSCSKNVCYSNSRTKKNEWKPRLFK